MAHRQESAEPALRKVRRRSRRRTGAVQDPGGSPIIEKAGQGLCQPAQSPLNVREIEASDPQVKDEILQVLLDPSKDSRFVDGNQLTLQQFQESGSQDVARPPFRGDPLRKGLPLPAQLLGHSEGRAERSQLLAQAGQRIGGAVESPELSPGIVVAPRPQAVLPRRVLEGSPEVPQPPEEFSTLQRSNSTNSSAAPTTDSQVSS